MNEVKIDKRTKEYKDGIKGTYIEQPNSTLKPVESAASDGVVEPIQQVAPIKVDLLHCPGCQVELLEDERNTKGPAYCRKCIWKNA